MTLENKITPCKMSQVKKKKELDNGLNSWQDIKETSSHIKEWHRIQEQWIQTLGTNADKAKDDQKYCWYIHRIRSGDSINPSNR